MTATFDPEEYPYLFYTWSMGTKMDEEGEFNPKLNPRKASNVLKFTLNLNGKHTDTITKGRFIDIVYLNKEGDPYVMDFNQLPKDLCIYVNFGVFPNEVQIKTDHWEKPDSDDSIDNAVTTKIRDDKKDDISDDGSDEKKEDDDGSDEKKDDDKKSENEESEKS